MKKIYLFALFLGQSTLFAQSTQGTIIYEETRQLQFNFGNDARSEEMKSMIPSQVSTYKQLLFTADASIFLKYENLEKQSANEMNFTNASGGNIAIKMKEANNEFFRNIAKGKTVEKIEFMSKDFIISEPKVEFAWKITGEIKTILDYTVMKATIEDTAGVIEAWFTTQIPVPAGPDKYGNLPGLILELSLEGGKRIFTATNINLNNVEEKLIVAPNKGKNVSREEFEKIRAEKMKEMEEMYGGKGRTRMIIDHE